MIFTKEQYGKGRILCSAAGGIRNGDIELKMSQIVFHDGRVMACDIHSSPRVLAGTT